MFVRIVYIVCLHSFIVYHGVPVALSDVMDGMLVIMTRVVEC